MVEWCRLPKNLQDMSFVFLQTYKDDKFLMYFGGIKRILFWLKIRALDRLTGLQNVVRYQSTVNICKAIKPVLYYKKRKLKMPRNFIVLNALGPSYFSWYFYLKTKSPQLQSFITKLKYLVSNTTTSSSTLK